MTNIIHWRAEPGSFTPAKFLGERFGFVAGYVPRTKRMPGHIVRTKARLIADAYDVLPTACGVECKLGTDASATQHYEGWLLD